MIPPPAVLGALAATAAAVDESPAPDDPWIAPAEARALRSPIAPGPDVAKRGRSLGAAGP